MKLLALDVDGTLLTSAHEVSPATVAAIAAARASGVAVVLVSSRGAGSMRPILRQLGLFEPAEFVAAQGGLTATLASDGVLRILHSAPIPLALARELVAQAAEAGFSTSWFRGYDWFVTHVDETIESESLAVGQDPVVRDLFEVTRAPEKLMLIATPERVHQLEAIAAALPDGLVAQTSGAAYLEITRSGVDKGVAIQRICRRRGISASEVVAVGDGPNDLALFQFAGVSVAMGNAPASVRQRATMVTGSNDEDGLAVAVGTLLASVATGAGQK